MDKKNVHATKAKERKIGQITDSNTDISRGKRVITPHGQSRVWHQWSGKKFLSLHKDEKLRNTACGTTSFPAPTNQEARERHSLENRLSIEDWSLPDKGDLKTDIQIHDDVDESNPVRMVQKLITKRRRKRKLTIDLVLCTESATRDNRTTASQQW